MFFPLFFPLSDIKELAVVVPAAPVPAVPAVSTAPTAPGPSASRDIERAVRLLERLQRPLLRLNHYLFLDPPQEEYLPAARNAYITVLDTVRKVTTALGGSPYKGLGLVKRYTALEGKFSRLQPEQIRSEREDGRICRQGVQRAKRALQENSAFDNQ